MTNTLFTYALVDLFPVTAEVYARLFVRLNEAVWPAHGVALAVGIAALFLACSGRPRAVPALLALAWFWAGYAFYIDLYAHLNWAAWWVGVVFIGQAIVLLACSLGQRRAQGRTAPNPVGCGIAAFGLFVWPLLGPLMGRPWAGIELFGIAPAPTVVVTLGLLLTLPRYRLLVLPVPLLWSFVVAVPTAMALNDPDGYAAGAIAVLVVAAWVTRAVRGRSD